MKAVTNKKFLKCLATIFISALVFTGCTKTLSYTFNVSTGDEIKVSLEESDGYTLTNKSDTEGVDFTIKKDDEVISEAVFATEEDYEYYAEGVEDSEDTKIIDKGEKDNFSYVMWNYNNEEFNCVVLINDSKTAVIIGNQVSEESAKECFERLDFEVK